jgi:hypothetical protein
MVLDFTLVGVIRIYAGTSTSKGRKDEHIVITYLSAQVELFPVIIMFETFTPDRG